MSEARSQHHVLAFGFDGDGQCDIPDLQGRRVLQVAAGSRHTVLVLQDGSALAFGLNNEGQCDVPHLRGRKVKQVATGYAHTVLIFEDGSARAYGLKSSGQCKVPNLAGRKAKQAAAGDYHTILVFEDGGAVAFGSNDYGQCKMPNLAGRKVAQAAAGDRHSVLVFGDGSVAAFGADDWGQCSAFGAYDWGRCSLPSLDGRKAVHAAAGGLHTVLVLEDGSAVAFGDNDYGQCTIPDLRGRKVQQASAGCLHTLLVLDDGSAVAFGLNNHGRCDIPSLGVGKKARLAAAGEGHNVLILEDAGASPGRSTPSPPSPSLPAAPGAAHIRKLEDAVRKAETAGQEWQAKCAVLEVQLSESKAEASRWKARCEESESSAADALQEVEASKLRAAKAEQELQEKSKTTAQLQDELSRTQAELAKLRVQAKQTKHPKPEYWSGASSTLPQGWAATPVSQEVLQVLRRICAVRHHKELGHGTDAHEYKREYRDLQLHCAWRIEDPALWARFSTEKDIVARQLSSLPEALRPDAAKSRLNDLAAALPGPLSEEVNESWFLHGTKPEIVLPILNAGLNDRVTKSSGAFGAGIYLAEDIEKIDQYTREDERYETVGLEDLHSRLYRPGGNGHPGEDIFYCFLVRGICGCQHRTRGFARVGRGELPPLCDKETGIQIFANHERRELVQIDDSTPPVNYHSLVVELGRAVKRFREFVIFDAPRTYIEYLLAYKRV